MRYTVAEKESGGVYVVITREDGSTYGQVIKTAGLKTAEDLDKVVGEVHEQNELRRQSDEAAAAPSELDVDALIDQPRDVDVVKEAPK